MTIKKTASLDADDISTARTGRRSAILMIGAVVTAVATSACSTGCSDSDPTDPRGSGRRCGGSSGCPSGCTDRDTGAGADPSNRGCRC